MNVMLHHFHGGGFAASPGSLSAEQFARMVDACPDELVFDDGLLCQAAIALPVLRDKRRRATFCVLTGQLDGHTPRVEVYRTFVGTFRSRDDFYATFYQVTGTRPMDPTGDWPDFYTPADKAWQTCRNAMPRGNFEAAMDTMMAEFGYEPDVVGRSVYMAGADILNIHMQGHTVGMHSHTHPMNMAELSAAEQRAEYQQCSDHIAGITGIRPHVVSHPSNSVSSLTRAILKDLGVTVGYRADHIDEGPLGLPREDHRIAGQRLGICE